MEERGETRVDGARFDRFTRALAATTPRRRVLAGLVGGMLGAAGLGAREDAAAACRALSRACAAGADCCSGTCQNGRCACSFGSEPCGANQCSPICPPGQYRGSGCRCLCRNTGRVPGPTGCPCSASSICDGGDIVFCGGTEFDCLCDTTSSGALTCSDFFAAIDIPCASDGDCPEQYACVTSFDCAQPYCALTCGSPSAARRSGPSPRIR